MTESKNVALFGKNGKKLRNIDISRNLDPYGVAVDNTNGCVYISGERKIIKFSPDFKLLGEFTGQEGTDYEYVAVVGGEVMVGERSLASLDPSAKTRARSARVWYHPYVGRIL